MNLNKMIGNQNPTSLDLILPTSVHSQQNFFQGKQLTELRGDSVQLDLADDKWHEDEDVEDRSSDDNHDRSADCYSPIH